MRTGQHFSDTQMAKILFFMDPRMGGNLQKPYCILQIARSVKRRGSTRERQFRSYHEN